MTVQRPDEDLPRPVPSCTPERQLSELFYLNPVNDNNKKTFSITCLQQSDDGKHFINICIKRLIFKWPDIKPQSSDVMRMATHHVIAQNAIQFLFVHDDEPV